MKKKKLINGGDLYVARARVILENDKITGFRRTAHENTIGYRLFLKKNDRVFIDILTGHLYPILTENLKEHDLFILDPKPFWTYAHCLRTKERIEDVMEIAEYVAIHFNAHLHNSKKWFEAKDMLHKIHHKNDDELMF